jgi:transcriptional regulator with XRE-family HTH domain
LSIIEVLLTVLGRSVNVNTNTTIGDGLIGGIMDEKEVCRLLGENIRRFRGWNKWTQELLAEKLNISANFLSNIENGKAWISPKTGSKLANVFKIELYELFMPESVMPPAPVELLFRYARETKESINMVLDEIEDKYTKRSTKN